ncbi:MAG: alpha/beta hydrolase [Saprospiraceae bacterium]
MDLPGYGKSDTGHFPYSMTFFADAVQQLIHNLALDSVTLVGHSMGGQIATHVALRQDSALRQLVLIAPAGFEQFSEAEHQWFQTWVTPAIIKATPEAQIVKNFEINFTNMPDDARFMIADRLQMRATSDYDAYCQMIPLCVKGMLEEPVYDRLKDITLPTLVLFGLKDQLIPNRFLHPQLSAEAVALEAVALIPYADLKRFPRNRHFLQWEASEGVNALIYHFAK